MQFRTALLGEFVLTDQAAPAVVLYNVVLAFQAVAWILFSRTALVNHLTKDEDAARTLGRMGRNGYFAFALYSLLALAAVWLPLPVAVLTTATWMVWLVMAFRAKHA